MSVPGKLKELTDGGSSLKGLYIDYGVLSNVMYDMSRSTYFQKAFLSYFYKFIDTVCELDKDIAIPRYDDFKVVMDASLALGKLPIEIISNLVDFKEIKESGFQDKYEILFQNAFIYAIACTYKSQIMRMYMRARSTINEHQTTERLLTGGTIGGKYLHSNATYVANYTDDQYITYMNESHILLARYVRLKNRLQCKKILAVIGYLINPNLGKE